MTAREIEETLDAFGQAARRAREAGFDGVQLHCAHGFLLSEFLSPHTNRRTDEWGGTPERRRRFVIEAFRRARAAAGPNLAVTVKLNCEDFIQDGLSLAESCEAARALAAEGIDAIEVSGWMAEGDERCAPMRKGDPKPQEEAYYLTQAVEIKRAVGAVPVGACGGFRSYEVMVRALEGDGLDFVAASRPFIAEPDLVARLRAGQPRATCISCNECSSRRDGPVHCPLVADGRLKPPAPGLFPPEVMTDRLDYKVELDTYSGPLDLLLYLIRQTEVDLWNIPIARITEQYLQYMELMSELNINVAGEFIVMAAQADRDQVAPDDARTGADARGRAGRPADGTRAPAAWSTSASRRRRWR